MKKRKMCRHLNELRRLRSQVNCLANETKEVKRQKAVLERKLRIALERLQLVASGRYYPSETEDYSNKDSGTASIGLKLIGLID